MQIELRCGDLSDDVNRESPFAIKMTSTGEVNSRSMTLDLT